MRGEDDSAQESAPAGNGVDHDDSADEDMADAETGAEEEAAAEEQNGEVDDAEAAPFETPACDLISAEELGTVLGVEFQEGGRPEDPVYEDECDFEVADPEDFGIVTIRIFATDPYPSEEAEWEQLKEMSEVAEEPEGLGDGAFVEGEGALEGNVTIRTEGAWVTLSGIEIENWGEHNLEVAEIVESRF